MSPSDPPVAAPTPPDPWLSQGGWVALDRIDKLVQQLRADFGGERDRNQVLETELAALRASRVAAPTPARHDLQVLVNRLRAIREEARTPKRDFNLDWQLGRLLDQLERLAQSSDRVAAPTPHESISRKANDYARQFNAIAEQSGCDLPISVIVALVDLFGTAMDTTWVEQLKTDIEWYGIAFGRQQGETVQVHVERLYRLFVQARRKGGRSRETVQWLRPSDEQSRVAAPTPLSELDRQVEDYKRCIDRGETVSLPDALWLLNELVCERDQRGKS